jgi:hypothetical protein
MLLMWKQAVQGSGTWRAHCMRGTKPSIEAACATPEWSAGRRNKEWSAGRRNKRASQLNNTHGKTLNTRGNNSSRHDRMVAMFRRARVVQVL